MTYPHQPPPPGYGYPPPPPPAYGRYGGYPPRPHIPRRPLAPRVVGILAVAFAPIGLIAALIWTFGPLSDLDSWDISPSDLGFAGTWIYLHLILCIVLFITHAVAGVLAITYNHRAPQLITIYGAIAITLAIADVTIMFLTLPDGTPPRVTNSLAFPKIFLTLASLPWPITALALMNTRRAKRACGAPDA